MLRRERQLKRVSEVNYAIAHAGLIGYLLGTAGAGSLILEFATLSRLTGDDRFEKAAYKVGATFREINI